MAEGRVLRGVMAGAGYFAGIQAEAWSRVPDVRLTAVADPVGARAEDLARRAGIASVYRDLGEMLEAERPDFVDVATPADTHRELTEEACRRGIPVICQKPLAPTREDCRAMVDAAAAAGVRLLVHENWRWQPWYREARRLVEAGRLGRPFHVAFRMRAGDGRGPEPYADLPRFRVMERLLIYETLVHFLDTGRYLMGEIESLVCQLRTVNPVVRGEDCALIALRFASGAHGLIDANRISGPQIEDPAFGSMWLEGDRGLLRLSPDGRLWLTEYGSPEAAHPLAIPGDGYRGDSVRAAQEHFALCLRSGRPCESEGSEYLRTMAAVFACYDSAQTGERVRPLA